MSDSFVLPKPPTELPLPYVIVCEGYGDAIFIDELLRHHNIDKCNVACPSNDVCDGKPGKNKLEQYLHGAIKFHYRNQTTPTLKGVLIVVDEDGKPTEQFEVARQALEFAEFAPLPDEPFVICQDGANNFRVAVFIMPGKGKPGTLESVLLEATLEAKPELQECLEKFAECTKIIPTGTPNQQAKMKMSVLVGATCKKNPWAPPSLVWRDKGNPIPIASSKFDHIVEFIKAFAL